MQLDEEFDEDKRVFGNLFDAVGRVDVGIHSMDDGRGAVDDVANVVFLLIAMIAEW